MRKHVLLGLLLWLVMPAMAQSPSRVDINQASAEQLQQLPGVGPGKAKAIVQYRAEHGRFLAVEELDKVPGFGAGLLKRLYPLVVVGDVPNAPAARAAEVAPAPHIENGVWRGKVN